MVTDILLNPDGKLWVYRADGTKALDERSFTYSQAMQLLGSVAAYAGVAITADSPLLQTALPWGQRFQGIIPPVVTAPTFAVRNHAARTYSLDEYVTGGARPS